MIIGYAVFDPKDIEHAALYPLSQQAEAYSAARRWGNCLSAVILHPQSPALDGSTCDVTAT